MAPVKKMVIEKDEKSDAVIRLVDLKQKVRARSKVSSEEPI